MNIENLFVDLAGQLPMENPFKKKSGGIHSLKNVDKAKTEDAGGWGSYCIV